MFCLVDKDVLMKWKQLETETLTVWQERSTCIIYSRSKGCMYMRQHERERERGGQACWNIPGSFWGFRPLGPVQGFAIGPLGLGTPSSRYGILKSHHVHISWFRFISKLLSIKFWERERGLIRKYASRLRHTSFLHILSPLWYFRCIQVNY